jgi:hypothetical protein
MKNPTNGDVANNPPSAAAVHLVRVNIDYQFAIALPHRRVRNHLVFDQDAKASCLPAAMCVEYRRASRERRRQIDCRLG